MVLWISLSVGCGGGPPTCSSEGSAAVATPPPVLPPPSNTIAGGITGLVPTEALGNDEVGDSGFESRCTNWNLPACFSIDSTQAHTGSQSLLFSAGMGCASPAVASTPVTRGLGAVRSYTLQGWAMTSPGSDLQVKVSVHDQTLQGAVVGETAMITPGTTWTLFQQTNIDLLPVHDGDTLSVQAVVQGTKGKAWFDDIELVEQLPLPISAFLLYPNYKGYLWGNGPQTIRLGVEVPSPTNMSVMATLEVEGGNTVTTIQQPAQTIQELDFDGSGLARGSYLVNATLLDATGNVAGSYPTYRINKVDATLQSTLTNYIDSDNFLVRKGHKHFVWGVYDRWSTHRCLQCTSTSEAGYLQIPGFNGLTTIQNYSDTLLNSEMNILPFAGVNVTPSNDQLTPWLAAVDSVGVGHLQIVNNWISGSPARPNWAANLTDSQLWQMLTGTQAGKPGGLGYYTYDEPTSNMIPTVFGQWPSLSAGDPGGVLFGTLARVSQVFRWRDMADVMSCDPYPVGNIPDLDDIAYGATTSPPMVRTSIWTRQAVQQSYGSRAVWMVLQLFDLNNQFPTYAQMRTQVYKAIINGATGILWWGFVSQQGIEYEWDVVGNQQPYFDFKKLSQEVLALDPILISQPRPDLLNSVSSPNVEFLVKAGSGPTQTVVFASNFTEAPIGNVAFSLSPSSPQNSVTVYGEGRTLPVTGGVFTDSFNGYDVHVYLVQ